MLLWRTADSTANYNSPVTVPVIPSRCFDGIPRPQIVPAMPFSALYVVERLTSLPMVALSDDMLNRGTRE